jgi:hypothetical protein
VATQQTRKSQFKFVAGWMYFRAMTPGVGAVHLGVLGPCNTIAIGRVMCF